MWKSCSITHWIGNMLKIVPFIDVCLLSVQIFAPKWMLLDRKTTQLGIFMWEWYWLEDMASFDSDTRLSLEPQLIYGSWMLAFSSSAFDCQNLSLAYKNIWTHIFSPRHAIWSPLVQFSFPLETFSLAISSLLDYKMPQSVKWCLLRLTV